MANRDVWTGSSRILVGVNIGDFNNTDFFELCIYSMDEHLFHYYDYDR
jgi:hypothetical protein